MQPQRTYAMYEREVNLYSHPAYRLDEWVIDMFDGMAGGSFVEIGAFDGMFHSNTAALDHHFNWSGALVEADEANFKLCQKNRDSAGNEVVQACIGAMQGRGRFFHAGLWSGLSLYLPKDFKRRLINHDAVTSQQTVTTLAQLLDSTNAPRVIHYLSLGVEGAELSILDAYFSTVQQKDRRIFQTLTFTSHQSAERLGAFERSMDAFGYTLEEIRGNAYCFSHHSLSD